MDHNPSTAGIAQHDELLTKEKNLSTFQAPFYPDLQASPRPLLPRQQGHVLAPQGRSFLLQGEGLGGAERARVLRGLPAEE